MSTAAEKANLARIRDNQRRSRARRKEYLHELEARLRQCELHGVEASSQIQMAARKVADENKKLRGLLAQHGIGDGEVEEFMQSSLPGDVSTGPAYGNTGGAVQVLEQLLQARKCHSGGSPQLPVAAAGRDSRHSSVSTLQSVWEPAQLNLRRQSGNLESDGNTLPGPVIMTPTSTASRTSSLNIGQQAMQRPPQHHRLVPVPTLDQANLHGTNTMFHYDNQQPLSTYDSSSQYDPPQRQAQATGAPQRSSSYMVPSSGYNVNSCAHATEVITTMTGGDPSAVRADLGCGPAIECEVDNHLVFNVMDRYSGVGL